MNFAVAAALILATGVMLGAFGAHGLKGRVDQEMLDVFEVAVRYQLLHGLALLAVVAVGLGAKPLQVVGSCYLGGILLFSGSLYLLVFSGIRWLGAITPIGGLLLICGHLYLAYSFWGQGRG